MAMESQKIFSHDNFVHSEMYYTPKFKKYFIFKTFLLYCFPLAFIPLISSSTTRHPAPHNNHTLFHVHEPFFLLVWSLQHLTPLSTSRAVNLLSESLYFSCYVSLFIRFPHISEIIWYSSFSDWLISLSIMFSRTIHALAKGKILFFWRRLKLWRIKWQKMQIYQQLNLKNKLSKQEEQRIMNRESTLLVAILCDRCEVWVMKWGD